MKKIKLLAIVPYEGLAEMVGTVAKKYEDIVETAIRVGDLQRGLDCGLQAERDGYDVVVSRGGTAELLLRNLSVPVVNIEVSGYDYMRAIKMATAIPGLKAIVGYSSITNHARSVAVLLDADIRIETVQSPEEIQQRLKSLIAANCGLVIGDVATYRVAREMGMNAMLITSGEESITSAFETSVWLMRSFGRLKSRTAKYESLLRSSQTVMAIIDAKERLRFESRPLESIGLSAEDLLPLLQPAPQEYRGNLVLQREDGLYNINIVPERDETGETYYLFDILHKALGETPRLRGVQIENFRVHMRGAAELFDASGIFDADTVRDAIAFSQAGQPVLITGKPGIGKVQIAKCMHRYSERWSTPFVQINCGVTDPSKALEALGLDDPSSALSCGATLCLAELDRLSPAQQESLRAALAGMDMERFHLAATSRRPLRHLDGPGDDISVLEQFFPLRLHIPSSGRTGRDMERFVNLNIIAFNSKYGKQIVGMEGEAMKQLLQYPWGADFEGLRRAVGQMVLLAQSELITASDVQHVMGSSYPAQEDSDVSLKGTLAEIEMRIICGVLREEKGNYSRTAARLGIGRSTLWRKLGNTGEAKKKD